MVARHPTSNQLAHTVNSLVLRKYCMSRRVIFSIFFLIIFCFVLEQIPFPFLITAKNKNIYHSEQESQTNQPS